MGHRHGTANGQSLYKYETITNSHSVGDRVGNGYDRFSDLTQRQLDQGLGPGSSFYRSNDLLGVAVAARRSEVTLNPSTHQVIRPAQLKSRCRVELQ